MLERENENAGIFAYNVPYFQVVDSGICILNFLLTWSSSFATRRAPCPCLHCGCLVRAGRALLPPPRSAEGHNSRHVPASGVGRAAPSFCWCLSPAWRTGPDRRGGRLVWLYCTTHVLAGSCGHWRATTVFVLHEAAKNTGCYWRLFLAEPCTCGARYFFSFDIICGANDRLLLFRCAKPNQLPLNSAIDRALLSVSVRPSRCRKPDNNKPTWSSPRVDPSMGGRLAAWVDVPLTWPVQHLISTSAAVQREPSSRVAVRLSPLPRVNIPSRGARRAVQQVEAMTRIHEQKKSKLLSK